LSQTEQMPKLPSDVLTKPTEPATQSGVRPYLITALLLLAVGAGVRFYRLNVRSLWLDEALTANISRGTWYDGTFTAHASRGSLKEVLEQTRKWGSCPITYPWILYGVEKIGDGPFAVRAFSALASIFTLLMMLAMVRANVDASAALLSAAILTVSYSQVRYAQEVREYSLSVLFASILVFCLLRWETAGTPAGHPLWLYAALFLAPFVQYGLVLFSFGILTTVGLLPLLSRSTRFRLWHGVIAAVALGTGGLCSYFLTLRYQLGIRQFQSYLADNYFNPKTTTLLRFLMRNSYGLMRFLFPGRVVALCFVVAGFIFCVRQARRRKIDPIAILTFVSLSITMVAALMGVYPYGGIRQCLFLAPVLALFAGVAFANLLERLGPSHRQIAAVTATALILLSGAWGMHRSSPYQEVEDVRKVLKVLSQSSTLSDRVYVHPGAAPGVTFYLQGRDKRFLYGEDHGDFPQEYVRELLASVDQHTDRIWLIFAHSHGSQEKGIIDSLRSSWGVERVVAANGATLYLARRESASLLGSAQP
jgi:hypothetical protein